MCIHTHDCCCIAAFVSSCLCVRSTRPSPGSCRSERWKRRENGTSRWKETSRSTTMIKVCRRPLEEGVPSSNEGVWRREYVGLGRSTRLTAGKSAFAGFPAQLFTESIQCHIAFYHSSGCENWILWIPWNTRTEHAFIHCMQKQTEAVRSDSQTNYSFLQWISQKPSYR